MYRSLAYVREDQVHILYFDRQQCEELHPMRRTLVVANPAIEMELVNRGGLVEK